MATALQIASLVYNGDMLTAVATVQGTASGAVSFLGGQDPLGTDRVPIPASGSGPYTLAFGHPELWWIWVQDSGGISTKPYPVWLTDAPIILNSIGQTLADLIDANKAALEVLSAQVFPNAPALTTVKQVFYGYQGSVDQYPCITVAEPLYVPEVIGAPRTILWTYECQIKVEILHNTDKTEIGIAAVMTGGLLMLLNRHIYNRITLPSGTILFNCQATRSSGNQVEVPNQSFGSEFAITWHGEHIELLEQIP